VLRILIIFYSDSDLHQFFSDSDSDKDSMGIYFVALYLKSFLLIAKVKLSGISKTRKKIYNGVQTCASSQLNLDLSCCTIKMQCLDLNPYPITIFLDSDPSKSLDSFGYVGILLKKKRDEKN
jgi:hypothetical protein